MKSIKTTFLTLCFVLISTFVFSQNQTWKEQSDFHEVMSKTFHPAEEGNFQPIKTRSAELVTAADKWMKSAIPADVADKKGVQKNLKKLLKDAKSLNKNIAKGVSDVELKNELTALHETFHTIVGMCSAKGEHEEH